MAGNPLTDGLTLSGGEPFLQAEDCAALARLAHERGLNVWTYTGYTYERLLEGELPGALALLEQTDVLVDGPFVQSLRSEECPFRGSSNQRLVDVPASLREGQTVLVEYQPLPE
jgi:anaerobic ribonucleoside-triphosphate reductase activating protein